MEGLTPSEEQTLAKEQALSAVSGRCQLELLHLLSALSTPGPHLEVQHVAKTLYDVADGLEALSLVRGIVENWAKQEEHRWPSSVHGTSQDLSSQSVVEVVDSLECLASWRLKPVRVLGVRSKHVVSLCRPPGLHPGAEEGGTKVYGQRRASRALGQLREST